MDTHLEVSLTVPELASGRLSPSDHIAAEVLFAEALERACATFGGTVAEIHHYCETYLEAWAGEEITGPEDIEPDTWWKMALRQAEQEVWARFARPAGALFGVRFVPETLTIQAFDLGRFEERRPVPF